MSKTIIFACVLLVCFACTCNYAHGVEIECIPLKSCPTALKLLLTAKHAPETAEFLKISHCGVDKKNQPMVWCSQLNFCVTPQNKNGTCTPLKKCKLFLKLRRTLDVSDPQSDRFLNKFRCNEILEEPHVCCQNEHFNPNDRDSRSAVTQPKLEINSRFTDGDYDDYHFSSDYSDHHDYYDSFQSNHKAENTSPETKFGSNKWGNREAPFGSGYDKRGYGRWDIPYKPEPSHTMLRRFKPHYHEDNHHRYHNSNAYPGFDHRHHDSNDYPGFDYRDISNDNNKHVRPQDNTTPEYKATVVTTQASSFKPTSRNRDRDERRWTTTEGNIPPTRTSTPSSFDRPTTRRTDSNFNIGEADIIFEDSFEDFLNGKPRSTTEATTRSSNRRRSNEEGSRKTCETPDSKPGRCTPRNNCQRYTTLESNLDRSLKSVRDYLEKFRCQFKDEVCCQNDDDNTIDNSVFSAERTDGNVPASISEICGRQTANTDRIVGGTDADLGEFPWLALLQYPSTRGIQFGCGGTLVNSRYVVTAAHCVDEQILKSRRLGQVRQVTLGEYDTRNKTDCIYMSIGQDCADPPRTYRVESIIRHKMYNSSTTQNDIALLRLDQDVSFTDYIKPICLPAKTLDLKGNETFIIAGWGRTSTEMFSPLLRKAKIPMVARDNCSRRTRSIIEGQICAGLGNGTDSCNGDSGGPLILQIRGNFEMVSNLVGVISYGLAGCGQGPSVNTYVPYYVDWINENMNL